MRKHIEEKKGKESLKKEGRMTLHEDVAIWEDRKSEDITISRSKNSYRTDSEADWELIVKRDAHGASHGRRSFLPCNTAKPAGSFISLRGGGEDDVAIERRRNCREHAQLITRGDRSISR